MLLNVAGGILIGLAALSGLGMVWVLCFTGEWNAAAQRYCCGKDGIEKVSPYLKVRAQATLFAMAFLLVFDFIVSRGVTVDLWVIRDGNASALWVAFVTIISAGLFFTIAGITLIRAWRLRVRHMYYVVIRNVGWSKLLDAAIEENVSFWLEYKSLLTSERCAATMILAWVFVVTLICIFLAIRGGFDTLRIVGSVSSILMQIIALSLIARLPVDKKGVRAELLRVAGLYLTMFAMILIVVNKVKSDRLSAFVAQCIICVIHATIFYVMFWWSPRRYANDRMLDEMEIEVGRGNTYDTLQSVLSDSETLASFMEFCCDRLCAENLLALLEIVEYKRVLRKQLGKLLKATIIALKIPTLKLQSSDSGSSMSLQSVKNELLFSRAKDAAHFEFADFISEKWTRWDLAFGLRLKQLGCRSAIICDTGDARSKALALCQKYFEWDSEFCLNISYKNRSKVLALVGADSSVQLEDAALLYVFDEAMCDVFDNLSDPLFPFLRAQTSAR